MEAPILNVQHLAVSFRDLKIFQDVSFKIERGSTTAVIGPNGAGKSVLLRTLIGSIPYEGEVAWAPGTKIGYVPQRIDLDRHLSLTLFDFLNLKAAVARVPRQHILDVLPLVHLSEAALSKQLLSLSGGELQRALIAFALVGSPSVLLFDEPTSGVDLPGEEQIYETLHRLQDERGFTVLFVSHDLSLVSRYASRVLCLNRAVFCMGSPEETLKPEVLDRLYGEPMVHHLHLSDHA
jgi:zinc transport system ATP-binding protein